MRRPLRRAGRLKRPCTIGLNSCAALDEETIEEGGEAEEAVSPKVVGHNIYILCHQLAIYNKVFRSLRQMASVKHQQIVFTSPCSRKPPTVSFFVTAADFRKSIFSLFWLV